MIIILNNIKSLEVMNMSNIICFHSPGEPNDFLSNWYFSNFTLDAIEYSSMEQYMMYQKAILFNDKEIASKILSTDNFAEIKALGRRVKGFNEEIWNKNKELIITKGLLGKFSQNPSLKEQLLATGNAILAECAVRDKIWGIGLSMTDEDRLNLSKWKGQNLLGKCLMNVREALK